MKRDLQRAVLLTTLLAWAGGEPAQAYVDPATGSYVLQILLAGILGAAFTLKLFWRRVTGALSNLFGRSSRSARDEP